MITSVLIAAGLALCVGWAIYIEPVEAHRFEKSKCDCGGELKNCHCCECGRNYERSTK